MTAQPPEGRHHARDMWAAQPEQVRYQPPPATARGYEMELPGEQDRSRPAPIVAPKNPAIALVLSFFIPGLGSMVSGNGGIGALILAVYVVGWLLSFFLIGIPILIGAWIWGMVKGYTDAQRWNAQHGIIS